jgi:hypothetical protein
MYRSLVCCSIASWLCSSQLSTVAIAEAKPVCQIVANKTGQMFTTSSLTNKLESLGNESYLRLQCTGNISGKLRVSLASSSKLYNASARFRITSANGVFPSTTSEYTDSPVVIAYANSSGTSSGEVRYQVQVVARNGYFLPAAPDYAVKLQTEWID